MLEYRFDLRGARESCGQGLCGCCTVCVDSKPVSSCLYLAVRADGASIDTIEGLAAADRLDPVQQAFIDAGACDGQLYAGFHHDGQATQKTTRPQAKMT